MEVLHMAKKNKEKKNNNKNEQKQNNNNQNSNNEQQGDVPLIPNFRDNGDGPLEFYHFGNASKKGIYLKYFSLIKQKYYI